MLCRELVGVCGAQFVFANRSMLRHCHCDSTIEAHTMIHTHTRETAQGRTVDHQFKVVIPQMPPPGLQPTLKVPRRPRIADLTAATVEPGRTVRIPRFALPACRDDDLRGGRLTVKQSLNLPETRHQPDVPAKPLRINRPMPSNS